MGTGAHKTNRVSQSFNKAQIVLLDSLLGCLKENAASRASDTVVYEHLQDPAFTSLLRKVAGMRKSLTRRGIR